MNDTWSDLTQALSRIWAVLEDGVAHPEAPARLLSLATTGSWGPESRMVVLRGADPVAGVLEVHTDRRSAKVADLLKTPRASLLMWDPAEQLQVRLRCEARILTGAATADRWDRIPAHAQRVYGGETASGTIVPAPIPLPGKPDRDEFAVLMFTVQEIEGLRLGRDLHRRACWKRSGGWSGHWLAP